MISCICLVQQGQAPDKQQQTLREGLNNFTQTAFAEAADIVWLVINKGDGFTAGKPSKASVVSITANQALTTQRRETLLHQLVEFWTQQTGCSVNDIVAVIADPQPQGE